MGIYICIEFYNILIVSGEYLDTWVMKNGWKNQLLWITWSLPKDSKWPLMSFMLMATILQCSFGIEEMKFGRLRPKKKKHLQTYNGILILLHTYFEMYCIEIAFIYLKYKTETILTRLVKNFWKVLWGKRLHIMFPISKIRVPLCAHFPYHSK